jgi:hypothetical protein
MHAVDTTGLQEDREALRLAEGNERGLVDSDNGARWRNGQRDAAEIIGRIAGDEFDLRDVATRLQAIDQRRELPTPCCRSRE